MADSTVAALTAAAALDGTELYYGVQAGGDVKVTGAQIKTLASASPTLVTPNLGTPSAGVLTSCTGTASGLTAGNVTTNANLTGDVTSVGNATTLTNAPVIAKVLTGYVSGAGTVSATDSILAAIQKLNGNDATNANLTGVITSVGNATSIASQTGTGTKFVVDTSPTLVTPILGVAAGTTLALNSATIGSNKLAVIGIAGFGVGNQSVSGIFGTTGFNIVQPTGTDTDTTSSGTIASTYINTLGARTLAASAATTLTTSATLFVDTPVAGTNVTATNKFPAILSGDLNLGFYNPSNTSGYRAHVFTTSGSTGFKLQRWSDNFGSATAAVWHSDNSQGNDTFTIDGAGGLVVSNTTRLGAGPAIVTSPSAAIFQHGAADAASPVAQTLQVQSVVAGTADTAGAAWTLKGSLGTGTGAGGDLIESTGFSAKSTGSGQGTAVDRKIRVAKGKVLTSAAAFAMFDVALPTLAMCGGVIEATIVCTNGTDMQSFTQTVTYSAVNKGGVYTTSITPSTGDKSVSTGTLTTSWTIVSGANKVTIKVTPTTSLTPSTNAFLLYYSVKNNSEQATTIL